MRNILKMPTKYDENAKLWTNPDENQLRELNLSINKWIWEKLSAHGSKVAQVFTQKKFIVFFSLI